MSLMCLNDELQDTQTPTIGYDASGGICDLIVIAAIKTIGFRDCPDELDEGVCATDSVCSALLMMLIVQQFYAIGYEAGYSIAASPESPNTPRSEFLKAHALSLESANMGSQNPADYPMWDVNTWYGKARTDAWELVKQNSHKFFVCTETGEISYDSNAYHKQGGNL